MKQILCILFVCLLFSTSSLAQGVCKVPIDLNSEVRPNGRAAVLSWSNDWPPDTMLATDVRYRVQVFDSEGTRILNGVFNDTTMRVRGLTQGEAYGWRVRTLCGDGNNSAYANSSFTTAVSCNDPSNLTSQVRPNGRAARLTWSPSSSNARYQVRVFDSGGDLIENSRWDDTMMVVRGLIPGESYTWGVQGRCGGGNVSGIAQSAFSTQRSAATSNASGGLVAFPNPTSQNKLTLSWDTRTFSPANILSNTAANTEIRKVSIAVLDYTGKALYQTQLESSQNQIELDVSTVATGLYFIQLTAENGHKAAIKFLKE